MACSFDCYKIQKKKKYFQILIRLKWTNKKQNQIIDEQNEVKMNTKVHYLKISRMFSLKKIFKTTISKHTHEHKYI